MSSSAFIRFVRRELRQAANPEKPAPMAAYMKTEMPFYGVQKPGRESVLKAALKKHPLETRAEVAAAVEALWALEHREEKYLAIRLARAFPEYVTMGSLPLYRRLIVEGAWWDFVDEVASKLIGHLVATQRAKMFAHLDRWIDHDDMWLRRTAIIAQLGLKDETDVDRLFAYCVKRSHEKEFFIRKAIGWALREHAKTDPDAVRGFLDEHGDELSTLSSREASKHL